MITGQLHDVPYPIQQEENRFRDLTLDEIEYLELKRKREEENSVN